MPDYNYLKNFVYSYLENFDYKYYQCNYATKNTGLSSSITQENVDNKEIYLCIFMNKETDCTTCNANNLTFGSFQHVVIFNKGVFVDYKNLKTIYIWNNTTSLNVDSGYANIFFNRQYTFYGRYPNILNDTNYYQNKKIDELKEVVGSNSGDSSNVSVNMDNTNNILMSILLAISVLIIYLVFKRLFFRSV